MLVQQLLVLSILVQQQLVLSKWVHSIQVLSMLSLSSCFPAKTIRWASIGIPSLSANLLFRFATVSLCSASKVMVLPVRVFTNVWILFWVSLRGSIIPLTNQGEPLTVILVNFILIFKVRLVCCISNASKLSWSIIYSTFFSLKFIKNFEFFLFYILNFRDIRIFDFYILRHLFNARNHSYL